MKIFEFTFSPRKSKNRFFEAYSYEPKSPKEKPRGSLYIVGELQNALELHSRFLRRLSTLIQREYYTSPQKGSGPALQSALKKANKFLKDETAKGNVDWLGNLHLAVLLFVTVGEKKTSFFLAKTGTVRVHMRRQGLMTDVGKNVKASSLGTVFGNVVSSFLVPEDSVAVSTKDIFDLLFKEKSLSEIASLKEPRHFHAFFDKRQKQFSKLSGVFMSFVIEKEEAKRSLVNKALLPALPKPKLFLPKGFQLKVPRPDIVFPWQRNPAAYKKRGLLVFLLALVLLIGALLFS